MSTLLNAVGFMAALGLILAGMLVVANRKLFVYEDPRIDQVESLLPMANCGICGTAGCRQFAETLVKGQIEPGRCTVNSKEMTRIIADFLGVEVGSVERKVARLACAGGSNVARTHAFYKGLHSCRAAALVSGGGRGCTWGCLGLADCEHVCEYEAITMSRHHLPVVDEAKCTGCGDCVRVCPKNLFSLHPVSHRLWVACMNRDLADVSEAHCEVVCTACARCAQDSPEGLIEIQEKLAVVDYSKYALASKVAIERCPTGAIVWLEPDGTVTKGRDAKKVVRKQPLPVVSS